MVCISFPRDSYVVQDEDRIVDRLERLSKEERGDEDPAHDLSRTNPDRGEGERDSHGCQDLVKGGLGRDST